MTASSLCEKLDEVNDTPSINFDCSICLELPHDPVVTMCGHLFCWSCLHRWITIQPVFQECPVCKACVKDKIIPLYGRGKVGFASTDTKIDSPRLPSAQQSYVHVPQSTGYQSFTSHGNRVGHSAGYQHQSFISQETHGNRSGQSPYSVAAASGLFPAVFGIHTITSPGRSCFGTSFNAPSRLLAVGSRTSQQQRLNAQQESVLYWFLFLLGCFASVCFLLF